MLLIADLLKTKKDPLFSQRVLLNIFKDYYPCIIEGTLRLTR